MDRTVESGSPQNLADFESLTSVDELVQLRQLAYRLGFEVFRVA